MGPIGTGNEHFVWFSLSAHDRRPNPHLIAARRPTRLALSSAGMLLLVERFARPLVRPVERLEYRIGGSDDTVSDAQRELGRSKRLAKKKGCLKRVRVSFVERAFRLDELTAWDVMVPSGRYFCLARGPQA